MWMKFSPLFLEPCEMSSTSNGPIRVMNHHSLITAVCKQTLVTTSAMDCKCKCSLNPGYRKTRVVICLVH